MTGKELDLEQYGYLSMLELVEALRDLFVLEGGPAGAILKERVAQQKPKVELPDVVVDSEWCIKCGHWGGGGGTLQNP